MAASNRTFKRKLEKEMQNVGNHFKIVETLKQHEPVCSGISISSKSLNIHTEKATEKEPNILCLNNQDLDSAEVEVESGYLHFDNETSSESESEPEALENSEFSLSFLASWAVKHSVTHTALSDLLRGMKSHPCFKNFPLDARTLLKTPTETMTREVEPGIYSHFGLKHQLAKLDEDGYIKSDSAVQLQFNIDGLPLYKSSRKEFWPILGYVCNTELSPLVIGLYVGEGKPKSVSCFLNDFVTELQSIMATGILLKSGVTIRPLISGFICDSPARAFLACIKSHTGYYACSKCSVKGSYVQNRVVYLETDAPLRTDQQFRNEKSTFEDHHMGLSPLEELDIDMVQDIPFEYMHLVCLGVVRKMILLWMRGQNKPYKLSSMQVDSISNNLIGYVSSIPVEFSRKPRSLRDIDRWKATELRQFLLYTGPLAIKDIVSPNHYQLFLCLHVAIRILVSEVLYLSYNDYANSLLRYVVMNFASCFGPETVSYNVHGLTHLAGDAKRFGPLDNFSAFRFENKLGTMKRLVKKSSLPLQQVHRRISEQENLRSVALRRTKPEKKTVCLNSHSNGPILPNMFGTQYKKVLHSKFLISLRTGNNSVLLTDGNVMVVRNIVQNTDTGQVQFIGNILRSRESLYTVPCNSKMLSTFYVKFEETELTSYPSESVSRKGIMLPSESKNVYLFIPIIHRES